MSLGDRVYLRRSHLKKAQMSSHKDGYIVTLEGNMKGEDGVYSSLAVLPATEKNVQTVFALTQDIDKEISDYKRELKLGGLGVIPFNRNYHVHSNQILETIKRNKGLDPKIDKFFGLSGDVTHLYGHDFDKILEKDTLVNLDSRCIPVSDNVFPYGRGQFKTQQENLVKFSDALNSKGYMQDILKRLRIDPRKGLEKRLNGSFLLMKR